MVFFSFKQWSMDCGDIRSGGHLFDPHKFAVTLPDLRSGLWFNAG
jgi:hypothetical protein